MLWVCFVVRDGALLTTRSDLRLTAGDEVLVLADSELLGDLTQAFGPPAPG